MNKTNDYTLAADLIASSRHCVAFTGAGISVESGIPTFRGPDGLWSRYDPKILDINYFLNNPGECWRAIKEIFYDYMGTKAKPNNAHKLLASLEKKGILKGVITQNIDGLHQAAGSKNVIEFHGTAGTLMCTSCMRKKPYDEHDLDIVPPKCGFCGGILKPDFIFFGEAIPPDAYRESIKLCENSDLLIIIGTTGEIIPASMIPYEAKNAKVIEINIENSKYTNELSDLFLRDRAGSAAKILADLLEIDLS